MVIVEWCGLNLVNEHWKNFVKMALIRKLSFSFSRAAYMLVSTHYVNVLESGDSYFGSLWGLYTIFYIVLKLYFRIKCLPFSSLIFYNILVDDAVLIFPVLIWSQKCWIYLIILLYESIINYSNMNHEYLLIIFHIIFCGHWTN